MKRLALLFLLVAPAACQPASTDSSDIEVSDLSPAGAMADEKDDKSSKGLTAAQAKTVLRLIDNTCGDTWCEGDHNFAFTKLVCSFSSAASSSCTLTMKIWTWPDTDKGETDATQPSAWRSCKVKGVHNYKDLVATDGVDLADGYYTKLTDCIDAIESKLSF